MISDCGTCGTCARYVEVFKKDGIGVCPCAYWLLSQEFTGIRRDTPINDSACEGESYEKRDSVKSALADIHSAEERLIVLRTEARERYASLSIGERLGEDGWNVEEQINDIGASLDKLSEACQRLSIW